MTMPRQVLPGSTWMVSRRCSERRYLLRPDQFVGRAFLYILGYAAAVVGIRLHCYLVMSNHWHGVVTDPRGMLPRFLQRVHRLVAVVVNVLRGRWEALWSSSKPSELRLESPQDVLDKMVYVLTNPVRAGLVERVSDWPGLWSDPRQLLRGPVEVKRPKLYFRPDGKMPADVRVRLSKPPGFEHLTDEQFVELLLAKIAEEEDRIAARLSREDRKPMGARAVLQQDIGQRSTCHPSTSGCGFLFPIRSFAVPESAVRPENRNRAPESRTYSVMNIA